VFFSNGFGPDFKLIPAGVDPLGRYTLTRSFYMMTTEVTNEMWDDFYGTFSNDLMPRTFVTWEEVVTFANELSDFASLDRCYENSDIAPAYINDIYSCPGYHQLW
jgi:formylglycine-generating enzyme required for sulfatase activity